jgi:hypothetical protein
MYGKDTNNTTTTTIGPPVDKNNGTVYVASQNLTWAKCSQSLTGSMYDAPTNGCLGTAGTFLYCPTMDSACDNLTILNGLGGSSVYNTCNAMNLTIPGFAGRTGWRVPDVNELTAFYSVYAANLSLFPSAGILSYWSSSVDTTANAWYVVFINGSVGSTLKANLNPVRCVSPGP